MNRSTLIVTCHPSPDSLCGRVAAMIEQTLAAEHVTVIVDDLYRRDFKPALSREELANYLKGEIPPDLTELVNHLQAAEALVFVFPIWMYGMPALLKGYFDRVWRPRVSFNLEGGSIRPLLHHIQRIAVVATHGMGKSVRDQAGDSTQLFFGTSLPSVLPGLQHNARFDLYGLDVADAAAIAIEFDRVRRHFAVDWK